MDELVRRLAEIVPPGLRETQRDVEQNLRAALNSTFAKLNLVTREEFEIQSALLARARTQLKALEAHVATLETQLAGEKPDSRNHKQEP
ncbi:MAG: accessory factor UbiK family protein [Gammaproteobacteria bacterium]|nr:accessory factor UbiK family protein [Gammaproteobacteria bacterium]